MRIIGKVGPYTVFTVPNEKVEPGHQWIGINDAGIEAAFVLAVLTGAEMHTGQETSVIDGIYCRVAPHDDAADQRLIDLVDLCASLRYSAPQLVQLAIEGLELDERDRTA